MNTFPNWREVGQAMRWARRQHGASLYHHVRSHDMHKARENEWAVGDTRVFVSHSPGWSVVNVTASGPDDHMEMSSGNAQQILRVLAALDLIPDDTSSAYRAGVLAGTARLADEIGAAISETQVWS